jgi:hypothetical protein
MVPVFIIQDGCTYIPSSGRWKKQRRKGTQHIQLLPQEGSWKLAYILIHKFMLTARDTGKCSSYSRQPIRKKYITLKEGRKDLGAN